MCSWAASCNKAMRCRQIACPARVCSGEWSGSLRTTLERRRAALRWGFNERSRTTRLPSRGGSSSLNNGSDSEMLCMSIAFYPNFLFKLFIRTLYLSAKRILVDTVYIYNSFQARFSNTKRPSSTSTSITSPPENSPDNSLLANGFSMRLRIIRFNGRAP